MNPIQSLGSLRVGRAVIATAVVAVMAIAAVACSGNGSGSGNNTLAAGNIPASLPSNYLSGNASPNFETYSGVGSYVSAQGTTQTGIWVTGTGSLDTPADMATVNLGVESRAETVSEAREAAATAMNDVLDAIRDQGVEDDDIKTTYFNIQPQTRYIERTDELGRYSEPEIVGYIVTNQVQVKVRDLDNVSSVVDTAASEGGDLIRINNISFSVANPTAHAETMRRSAAEDARKKAQVYADAMGVELGDLVFLTETGSSAPSVNRGYAEAAMDGATSAPTPIQGGDVSLTTTIQAAFAIVP